MQKNKRANIQTGHFLGHPLDTMELKIPEQSSLLLLCIKLELGTQVVII